MQAIVNRRYGPPDGLELRDVEPPPLAPDGVLVRVRAASVNPYDWHVMRGTPVVVRAVAGVRRPRRPILGVDFAGVVEAVGGDVSGFSPGDEVFGGRDGSFAELVCARRAIAPKPASLSFEEAAAVPTAATTALQALRDRGRLRAGERVLVNGAAGGVGTFAVQIAKALSAHVTGVCSTANVELVRSLGADAVVDYTRDDVTRSGERWDVVVNNVDGARLRDLRGLLAERGRLVLVAGSLGAALVAPAVTRLSGRRVFSLLARLDRADLLALTELIEDGKVRPVVDRTYPLAEAAAAIRHLESRHARGKTVLSIA